MVMLKASVYGDLHVLRSWGRLNYYERPCYQCDGGEAEHASECTRCEDGQMEHPGGAWAAYEMASEALEEIWPSTAMLVQHRPVDELDDTQVSALLALKDRDGWGELDLLMWAYAGSPNVMPAAAMLFPWWQALEARGAK